jgi:transcriptional regulator with XRE-family HTH domain
MEGNMKRNATINSNEYLKIGSFIRKWRNIKGMKQAELARHLHISVAAVSHIENDISIPNLHKLEDIADSLNISMEMLLSGPEALIEGNKK